MKKRLAAVLSVLLTFTVFGGTSSFAASGDQFTDVDAGSWYKEYVDFVAENGYMIGTSDTTFEPQSNLTRAMFATILARYHKADVDDSKETIFSDVPVDQWFTGSIGWNNEKGIVQGYGDGTFGTNDFITRQDLATMIIRYIPVYEQDYNKVHQTDRPLIDYEFVDADEISDYAKDAIAKCVDYGLLEGYPDQTIKPKQNITRAETAAIIYRLAWLTKPQPQPSDDNQNAKYEYVVTASVTKDGKGPELTAVYSSSEAKKTTVSDIAKDLIVNNDSDNNKDNIINLLDELAGKVRDGGPITINGYTITTTAADKKIHVDGVDLPAALDEEVEVYNAKMESVRTQAGIEDTAAWQAFVESFSADNLFNEDGTDLTMLDSEEYYEVLSDAVTAAADLYDEVATAEQYQTVLDAAEAAGVNLGVHFDGLYEVLGSAVDSPEDLNDEDVVTYLAADNKSVLYDLVKDGKTTVFKATETVNSADDVVTIVNNRTSRDWSGRQDIKAVLSALEDMYTGTYNVKVTVKKQKVK